MAHLSASTVINVVTSGRKIADMSFALNVAFRLLFKVKAEATYSPELKYPAFANWKST